MKAQLIVIIANLLILAGFAQAGNFNAVSECPNLEGEYQINLQKLTIKQALVNNFTQYTMVFETPSEIPETVQIIADGKSVLTGDGQFLVSAICEGETLVVQEENLSNGKIVDHAETRFNLKGETLFQRSLAADEKDTTLWDKLL